MRYLLIGVLCFGLVGCGCEQNPISKEREEKRGRIGLIEVNAVGTGVWNKGKKYHAIIEIEEIERKGYYSKVKITDVSGVREYDKEDMADLLPTWIATDRIQWLTNDY